ncbi:LytTR family transcriptional regulator DNA-binding domain-containing protein [Lacrimispora sp. AGF001]|jgi:DNA-binding LytR/AlgR family response regulator|uniref:LytTR family transcriptional regulator DNA-binding domain-containing protein n=1 Tax=Lacrimispora sp. AGF001 TaxID=3401631 RepID=UPI003B42E52E|nr:LytTR family transcriptional regulator [Paenibacillaceae bacterium]
MKIAFLIDQRVKMIVEGTEYNMILLYPEKQENPNKLLKYTAFFNGKPYVFNMREILYLESYYRKTSIVLKNEKMRIKARLNEEEGKLPKDWFTRISRHDIINMQHIKTVKGDEVEMVNGDILYISHSRRKEFGKNYRAYLTLNDRLI